MLGSRLAAVSLSKTVRLPDQLPFGKFAEKVGIGRVLNFTAPVIEETFVPGGKPVATGIWRTVIAKI